MSYVGEPSWLVAVVVCWLVGTLLEVEDVERSDEEWLDDEPNRSLKLAHLKLQVIYLA